MASKGLALVTGASAGIGREYARQLGARCDRMILVGRREDRLREVAEELADRGVAATVVAADLDSDAGVQQVLNAISSAGPLDFLVNNAGFNNIGAFDSLPLARLLSMVQVHITATLALTHAALPAMKQAGRGAIVNVSSMCAFIPYLDVAVYGGTKAFLTNYSTALGAELQGSGVRVQCLVPGFTHTELHTREAFDNYETPEVPEELWMQPHQVVAESLATLDGDRVVVVAGEVNRSAAREALQRDLAAL